MKIFLNKIFPVLLTVLVALFFISCQEDPIGTDDINNALPEVKAIGASKTKIIAGATVDIEVVANGTNTYSWSADYGTFGDASAATTTWTSDGIDETMTVKLTCVVNNSAGPRPASVSITTVILTDPFAHWSFDTDKVDAVGDLNAVGDGVTINTTDAKIGAGCASFPGLGDEFDPSTILLVEDSEGLALGPENDYSVALWVKTSELGCMMYGRLMETDWDWDAEGLKTWGFWEDYGEPAMAFVVLPWTSIWTDGAETLSDGDWHHAAAVHYGEDDSYLFYIDGELIFEGNLEYDGETPEDGETIFAMGGNSWMGVLNGLMDDFKYYDTILGEAEIALLADE